MHATPRLLVALGLLTAFGCAAQSNENGSLTASDAVASTEQALSTDPGPKDLFVGDYLARFWNTRSDGTYVYVQYRRDQDKYCFGRVLRMPVGGGPMESASAPCFAQDYAIGSDGVYFAAVTNSLSGPAGGIYRVSFGDQSRTALTTRDALAIATDGSQLFWYDGAALHRMRPDATGDVILATNAAVAARSPLLVDGKSIYGYDGATLWKVPKKGGAKLTLATVGANVNALQLDHDELFWIDGTTRIARLPIAGGTPTTVYETDPSQTVRGSVAGLGVAGKWVYWSTGTDLKRRAKTGGPIATIDTDEAESSVLAADATNVYYTSRAVVAPPLPLLRRLPLADLVAPVCSTAPRELASIPVGTAMGLAVAGTWIYYSDWQANAVRRVWKNGGSVETVAVDQPEADLVHAGAAGLAWKTLEGVNSKSWGSGPVSPGALYAANARDVVVGASDPTDPFAMRLYYNDGSRIVGLDDTTLATSVTPYRLAGDENWIYWTDRGDQTLNRVPRLGGDVEVLVRLTSGELGELTLDLDAVFYTVNEFPHDGIYPATVRRVPKSGGAETVLADGLLFPFALEVSDSYLYFSSYNFSGVGPSNILYKVPKSGGPLTVRAMDEIGLLDTLGTCMAYNTSVSISVVAK